MERFLGNQQVDQEFFASERYYDARPEYYNMRDVDADYGGHAVRLPTNYLDNPGVLPQSKSRHQELAFFQQYYGAPAQGGATKRPLETAPDYFVKKPRPDVPVGGPMWPQRPGELECPYYMKTGSCSYGAACRFDHPPWVPPGGASTWKAGFGPVGYPERPSEPECAFYMRTGFCKFGAKCKFHHPRDHIVAGAGSRGLESRVREEALEATMFARHRQSGEAHFRQASQMPPSVMADLPHTWGEYPEGLEYEELSRTAGANGLAAAAAAAVSAAKIALAVDDDGVRRANERGGAYGTPAPLNSKGLPIRQDELDCAFYMKSGSCKYGAVCKFHHPEGVAGSSPPPGAHPLQSQDNGEMWLNMGGAFRQYPERPGQPECAFYIKTGTCKFGPGCKFHHPRVRSPAANGTGNSSVKVAVVPVKLTLAGLPRREGEVTCAYYMKTGACRYGAACKFDHPPPGEAAAKAAALASRKEGGSQELDVKAEEGLQKVVDNGDGPVVVASEETPVEQANEG